MRVAGETIELALRELAAREPLRLRVAGTSMTPTLFSGDVVEVSGARFYFPGDVIVFRRRDGGWIIHRLIGYWVRGGKLQAVTQGDASSSCEAAFGFDRVVGRIKGNIPFSSRLWAMSRFGRLVVARLFARTLGSKGE